MWRIALFVFVKFHFLPVYVLLDEERSLKMLYLGAIGPAAAWLTWLWVAKEA